MDTAANFLPLLSGPAAAVLVLSGVLWGLWKLVDTRLLPLGEKFIERHLGQIDALIASHNADRSVWAEGLQGLRSDIDQVSDDVAEIRGRIDQVLLFPAQTDKKKEGGGR